LGIITALQIAIPTDPTTLLIWIIAILVIGLIVIIVLGFLFAFPIAALAAILVWFLTGGDWFLAAITFLVVALIVAIIGRNWRATRTTHVHEHEHYHDDHEHVD